MGKINSFLKNKNTVTIFGVVACLVILYAGYTIRIRKAVQMVTVYYAIDTIQPKTLITEDMIGRKEVPAISVSNSDYCRNANLIIGKYSNYNTMIAKGSLFYNDLLIDEKNLPDAVLYDINDGERLVSFPVNMTTTYGNTMMPGNLIDIYVKLVNKNGDIIYGKFFDKIKVLGVKDSAGNNVFENTDQSRTPAYLYFSLPENKYLLFSALNYVADIYTAYDIDVVLVPNTQKYVVNADVTEVSSSYLYNFVLKEIETIDNQRELYNQLLNEIEQKEAENNQ